MNSTAWTKLSDHDCTNGGKYFGLRYVEKADRQAPGMALLYDVQGTIAGIQMIVSPLSISYLQYKLCYK